MSRPDFFHLDVITDSLMFSFLVCWHRGGKRREREEARRGARLHLVFAHGAKNGWRIYSVDNVLYKLSIYSFPGIDLKV